MPNAPARRPVKSASIGRPTTTAAEPRGARRRRETRARLLRAAFRLMAEKGMHGVAINEITEAADVGFGSFYNHFESKEAIYDAVVDGVFDNFADSIEGVITDISDPAEVIAVSTRYTMTRALREPLWGQFLVREGFSSRSVDRGLGRRLLRDIRTGVAAKRLDVPDLLMSFVSVAGTALGAVSVALQLGSVRGPRSSIFKELGSSLEGLPERTASVHLQVLGVGRTEAQEIACRPLPAMELPALTDGSRATEVSTAPNMATEPTVAAEPTRWRKPRDRRTRRDVP